MPIREYLCHDCGYGDSPIWEEIVAHPEDAPNQCPRCESKHIDRIISAHSEPRGNFGTPHKKHSRIVKRSIR